MSTYIDIDTTYLIFEYMDIQHPENLIVILFANCLTGDDHMDMDDGVDCPGVRMLDEENMVMLVN